MRSALAVMPGLLMGALLFGNGLLLDRAARAGVKRAVSLRDASADDETLACRVQDDIKTS